MEEINVYLLQKSTDTKFDTIRKLINFGFKFNDTSNLYNISNLSNSKLTINLQTIYYNNDYTEPDIKFYDCLFWYIPWKSLVNLYQEDITNQDNPTISTKYYFELEIIKKMKKFTKYIILMDMEELNISLDKNTDLDSLPIHSINHYLSQIFGTFELCPINMTKAINYLSLIHNDITQIDLELINATLKEELGKQIFKKLDTVEKKYNQIKELVHKYDIINDWINQTGFNKLIDIIQININSQYQFIINSHAQLELINIVKRLELLQIDNIENNSNLSVENISNLIIVLSKIIQILNIDLLNKNNEKLDTQTNLILSIIKISSLIKILPIDNIENSQIDMYLNSLNIFVNMIKFDTKANFIKFHSHLKTKSNKLIKKKLLLTFDEKLFNELFNTNLIDIEFFKQCVDCCLKNDWTNLPNLIKFSSTHSPEYSEVIIKEFVQMDTHNNNINFNINIQESLFTCITQFMNTFIIKKIFPDVKLFSKFIFKILCLYSNYSPKYLNTSLYIFNKYIGNFDTELLNINKLDIYEINKKLYLHNINLNFKILVENFIKDSNIDELFDNIDDYFIHQEFAIKILQNISKLINNENDNNAEENESEGEIESDDNSEINSDSDDLIMVKAKQVENIYNHLKNALSARNLNQSTIKTISEFYWNNTKSYTKSIEMFQKEIENKTFTKLYKKFNSKN